LEEYYTGITNKNELSKLLTKLKKEWPELNDVYSKCLQPEVDRLFHNLKSLRGLEKTGRKIGKLRFKGESWFKTITYNQSGFKLLPGSNKFGSLQLSKIGKIPIRLHREVKGDIKQVTIKHMSSGEWYAFLVVDDGVGKEKTTFIDKMVGIDVGLVRYVVDSDCLEIENPHHLKQQLKRLRKEQKKLSRKKRGSSNYQKQRTIVASTHEIVQNQRNDFQHKLSRYYVDNYDIIVSEKLSTDNLMEKRHLARNIADASWSSFNQKLAYKAERAGKLFVQVDPRGTSQICSSCGKLVPKSLSDRWHDCPYCGLHLSRDHNASINILNRGVEKVRSERPELTLVDTGPLQLPASSLQADWMKQEALPDKVKQFT
jgi:putative transposase